MTPEQEALAEKVIKAHKENNGVLDWHDYFYYQDNPPLAENMSEYKKTQLVDLIQSRLVEYGFIERIGREGINTRLRKAGFEFESFEAERQKRAAKEKEEAEKASKEYEKLHLEIENLRNQFFDYEETKAKARRAEIISIITTIVAIAALILSLVKE